MSTEVVTLVRLPISEVVEMIRQKHQIREAFSDVRLEGEFLAFYFSHGGDAISGRSHPSGEGPVVVPRRAVVSKPGRRARKRRNRMKTRGWPVVAKIVNEKGQTAVVYQPFVDALSKDGLSRRDQRMAVDGILRANGNRPSEASVQYFLGNTLEYLRNKKPEARS